MKVSIGTITNIIGQISSLTSGDKNIPGVLLELTKKDDMDRLKVCYSDGHKSLIREVDVTIEENDYIGSVVVDFNQFKRAIDNCQPSGIIKVDNVTFEYLDIAGRKIIRVSADQCMEVKDSDGNVANIRKLAHKSMDLNWVEPGSDMKSAILVRMKYDDIFNCDDITPDEYVKSELIDAFGRTSVEKGKQVYVSAKVQTIFVANQAHVTAVPVSALKDELPQDDADALRAEMTENGTFTDEAAFMAECKKRFLDRIHYSLVITQTIAKAVMDILNKTDADKVFIYRRDKYCNIFIDTDTEKLGIWFEMAPASNAHLGALERYSSMEYKSYQLMFFREFLDNNIKSALNSGSSEKIELKFDDTTLEQATSLYDLIINCSSSKASISDIYRVNPDNITDPTGDIKSRTFTVSLKVLADMMAQLKTELVAFDINVGENNTVCVRLAEIDYDKMTKEHTKAREETKAEVEAAGQVFDPNTTPTPVQKRLDYRIRTLKTKQYTMLSK